MSIFFTTFFAIFLAELGDKTQLATLLFASDTKTSKWLVFAGAALALITTSAIAVMVGSALSSIVSERTLKIAAGAGFMSIGTWTLWTAR